jgi:hypothetical protein
MTEAQKQQRSAAYQDCADRRFDDIDRQHWLHTDAVSEFAIRREENCRTPSGSIDIADFVVLCVARTVSASLELLQVSTRSGEMAANSYREVIAILDRHARDLPESSEKGTGRRASPPPDLRKPTDSHRGMGSA